MKSGWNAEELKFLRSLNTPFKIQSYLDSLPYNPSNGTLSPRYSIMSGDAHCLEGALLAAAALECQGQRPLVVNLLAHNDDNHILAVYKAKSGWGSVAKSNTTLLRGRSPYYKSVRELVMSYFDVYFNVKRRLALYAYSSPVNLNRFNHYEWRTSEQDLERMGVEISQLEHVEILPLKEISGLPKVTRQLAEACFLGADERGLYRP